jgi:hypothetical protein
MTVSFSGRGTSAMAWTGGPRWRGGLKGGHRARAVLDGELHVEDEVAGVGGSTVALAGGFTCGRRHGVMAKPRCSWTTAVAVAGRLAIVGMAVHRGG